VANPGTTDMMSGGGQKRIKSAVPDTTQYRHYVLYAFPLLISCLVFYASRWRLWDGIPEAPFQGFLGWDFNSSQEGF